MADYAIGDVQGCFEPLQRLLDKIHFNERKDRLWFVGDLVNRGPQSLAVLRFVKSLPLKPHITLGNHDLHLLARLTQCNLKQYPGDTLDETLQADDAEELAEWLRIQPLLVHDKALNVVMSHAGIAPCWTLAQAQTFANEFSVMLSSADYKTFLQQMYGNNPSRWRHNLTGMGRMRIICNYFTRMRYCYDDGQLDLTHKGSLPPVNGFPWFQVPSRRPIAPDIVFGHWAALRGRCDVRSVHAIDTGCVWGGRLTALRLHDKVRFSVDGVSPR